MGSQINPFISLSEAARVLGRTPNEVMLLCDEGLIRRKSTGKVVTVHKGDVKEVYETNLNDMARPRDLVKKVLLLEREVRALREIVDIIGAVNGLLSNSLSELDTTNLINLRNTVVETSVEGAWSIEKILQFSEIFLRISDSDIVRLNDAMCDDDSWRVFYDLCLKMSLYCRSSKIEQSRDLEMARALLQRGLRNLRSIGVLFTENKSFLKTSRKLLEDTMSHDINEFDTLIKQLKFSDKTTTFVQND